MRRRTNLGPAIEVALPLFSRKGEGLRLLWAFVALIGGQVALPCPAVAAGVVFEGGSPLAVSCSLTGSDTTTSWLGSVRLEREFIASDQPQWTDWQSLRGLLIRTFEGGALGLEVGRLERFGLNDDLFTVDGYKELWSRAYANLRVQLTPDPRVLPDWDVRGEIFQAVGNGWELSGSYRRMVFAESDVEILGAGLAKYLGQWYLRQIANVSWLGGQEALSFSFAARKLLQPPEEFAEFSGGLGTEVVVLGPGPRVENRETWFVRATLQRFLSTHWGFSAAAMYNRFEGTPERWGGSLGLVTRF